MRVGEATPGDQGPGGCQQASRELSLRRVEDPQRARRPWRQELPHKSTPLFIEHLVHLDAEPHRDAESQEQPLLCGVPAASQERSF